MDGRDDELDALRIRQHAMLRRAIYRSRSHAIIAAGVCAVAAAQLTLFAVKGFMSDGLTRWPVVFAILAPIAVIGTIFFLMRAIALHREAKKSAIQQGNATPDFSSLGDGSDLSDRLNNIQ